MGCQEKLILKSISYINFWKNIKDKNENENYGKLSTMNYFFDRLIATRQLSSKIAKHNI